MTTNMRVHPLADIIPPMSDAEYRALVEDIRLHGLVTEIVTYEGQILDGRHRYRACLETGQPWRTRDYEGDDPALFVLSANIVRRHLTKEQRLAVAVQMKDALTPGAKVRQQAGRVRGGKRRGGAPPAADPQTDASGSNDPQATASPERVPPGQDAGRTADQIAAALDLSATTVKRAVAVYEREPDLWNDVQSGSISVGAAYHLLTEREAAAVAASDAEPEIPEHMRAFYASYPEQLLVDRLVDALSPLVEGAHRRLLPILTEECEAFVHAKHLTTEQVSEAMSMLRDLTDDLWHDVEKAGIRYAAPPTRQEGGAADLDAALGLLVDNGLACYERRPPEGGTGAPVEGWFAVTPGS